MKKNQEIEVLRAVAILFVLLQHLCILLFPPGSIRNFISVAPFPLWGGVDLFFCISGYVIALGLYPQLAEARESDYWKRTAAFWLRRFYRIVPSLWLWVALWLACVFLFNRAGNFGPWWPNVADAVAAVLNLSNWHIFSCVGLKSVCGPNPVYWSLSLEEQFYLALPFVLLLPKRWLTGVLLAVIVLQFPWPRMPWDDSFSGALWFVRTDALLIGVLIGINAPALRAGPFAPTLLRNPLLRLAVTGVLVASLALIPKSLLVGVTCGAVALVCGALVYIASFDQGFLMPANPLRRVLIWIGTRSFSIYLIHIPAYYFVMECFYRLSAHPEMYAAPLPGKPHRLLPIPCVLLLLAALAELNYRFVEVPFREKGRQRTHRSIGTPATEVPITAAPEG
jgi:peptidoglycan/LPS O-acetylase OafA/YrhL